MTHPFARLETPSNQPVNIPGPSGFAALMALFAEPPEHPVGRLRSLLEMIRFDAGRLASLYSSLKAISEVYSSRAAHRGSIGNVERNDHIAAIDGMLSAIGGMGLALSEKSLLKAKEAISAGGGWLEVGKHLEDFSGRLQDEMEGRFVFALPQSAQAYWEPSAPLFGQEVNDAFPTSAFDVSEAGKCYALGRFTACVMHLMRALETPLKVQGLDLGVSLKRDNWGDLLGEIESAIYALKSGDPKKEFHSGAAIQFTHIKNAWRNASMHQRAVYGEDDAAPIMASVKALMRQLAKQLHE